MQLTDEQFLAAFTKVVEEKHPGYSYSEREMGTSHKMAASVSYSYEDCIVGCLLNDVAPEIRSLLMVMEMEWHGSMGMSYVRDNKPYKGMNDYPVAKKIRERFTESQIRVLTWAQVQQDGGVPWARILHATPEALRQTKERTFPDIDGLVGSNITGTLIDTAHAMQMAKEAVDEIIAAMANFKMEPIKFTLAIPPSTEDVLHHEAELSIPDSADAIKFPNVLPNVHVEKPKSVFAKIEEAVLA